MHQTELMYICALLCIISALCFQEMHMAAEYHKLPFFKMSVFLDKHISLMIDSHDILRLDIFLVAYSHQCWSGA